MPIPSLPPTSRIITLPQHVLGPLSRLPFLSWEYSYPFFKTQFALTSSWKPSVIFLQASSLTEEVRCLSCVLLCHLEQISTPDHVIS